MTSGRFTASSTVEDVVHADPALGRVLNSFGIDTCCGGSATLAEATGERGVSLDDLLAALHGQDEPARANAAPPAPSPVQMQPPAADPELAALKEALAPPIETPRLRSPARYVRFFVASLLFALTFGATLGALTLATITLPWSFIGGLPVATARTAHAYAQVFGFAALFVMGVAYHAVPRFKATYLAGPPLAAASFWLQTGGVVAISGGTLVGPPADGPLALLGGVALLLAAGAFGWIVRDTLAAGEPAPEGFERFLIAGCAWLGFASLLSIATAAGARGLLAAVWEAALYGFAGSWLFGMSLRIVPVFLNTPAMNRARSGRVFSGYQIAVVFWVAVAIVEAAAVMPALRGLAGAALAAAAAAFVWQLGVFRSAGNGGWIHGFEKFLVAAYSWFIVALVFGPAWTAGTALGGNPMPSLLFDFGRHAFTIGFLTQMVVGVANRIVPAFTGAQLWSTGWRDATFYLLNGAVLARGLQAVVELSGWAEVWPYVALSGLFGLAAFGAFGINVVMTVRARAAA